MKSCIDQGPAKRSAKGHIINSVQKESSQSPDNISWRNQCRGHGNIHPPEQLDVTRTFSDLRKSQLNTFQKYFSRKMQ